MSDESDRLQRIASDLSLPEHILQAVKGPTQARPDQAEAFVPPRTETERKVAALWADVLGLDAVGVHDDFFTLGGHSLMVVEMLSRVRALFGVDLPLSALFTQAFTASELARHIELAQIDGAGRDDVTAVLDTVGQLSDDEVKRMLAGQDAK